MYLNITCFYRVNSVEFNDDTEKSALATQAAINTTGMCLYKMTQSPQAPFFKVPL